jgi:phosphoribosylamine---glycine ligase
MTTLPEIIHCAVIGSGGREHAIIKTIKRSPRCGRLYAITGNGGIAEDAICLSLSTHEEITHFCKEQAIDLVIIGPEQPIVDGLSDYLRTQGIRTFAPSQAAGQLEASKSFTKHVCDEGNIPTASYAHFTNEQEALTYIASHPFPIVIKADGLAAGKGVVIAQTPEEAQQTIKEMFAGKFGDASRQIVIEAFLQGEEVSFFALCDGEHAVPFGSAQDHKTAYDGDTGPNTGGMGTYSPAPIMNEALEQQIMDHIIFPTLTVMKQRGTPYTGILFAGLMIENNHATLIEFNTRLGDPETQVILTRLQDDLLALCFNAANGQIPSASVHFSNDAALCVVMAANGYPNEYQKNTIINGLENVKTMPYVTVFHAGTTRQEDGTLIATGGRVLGITATGANVTQAQQRAYAAVDTVIWRDGFCRRDIGWRAIARENK